MMRRRRTRRHKKSPWFAWLREFAAADLEFRDPLPDLTEDQILVWADAYFAREGEWPNDNSGDIPEAPGESWMTVEAALSLGLRGLPGGSTLARFLAEHRGRFNLQEPPSLTIAEILAWADAWHAATGRWPTHLSGKIPGAGGMTWSAVHCALVHGRRGLRRRSSLARLLETHRGVRNRKNLPPLTEEGILAWADAHHRRTGNWPTTRSGRIPKAPGENWNAIGVALWHGVRGLAGGTTLARLLAARRGKHYPRAPRRLTCKQILAWADAWHARTGTWPNANSGIIPETDGTTWATVDSALRVGRFGLRGSSSLPRLLAGRRGVCNRKARPPYSEEGVLAWADAHRRRTGSWPNKRSGRIVGTRSENWGMVDAALRGGTRGLPGGSSMPRLLAQRRGVPENVRPALDEATILAWADAHHARTGEWPRRSSGTIVDAPGETWNAVNVGLIVGRRGLPGGTTLARLLLKHRGVRIRKRPLKVAVVQIGG